MGTLFSAVGHARSRTSSIYHSKNNSCKHHLKNGMDAQYIDVYHAMNALYELQGQLGCSRAADRHTAAQLHADSDLFADSAVS